MNPSKPRHSNIFIAVACVMTLSFVSACGESPSQTPAANNAPNEQTENSAVADVENTQPTNPAEPVAATTPPASLDTTAMVKRGQIIFFKCRACHEVSPEGPHKVGPSLHGLLGREAGQVEGFVFSEAMKNSGIVWSDDTLDEFIERPASSVAGTNMAFVGIGEKSDRQALIEYLRANTQ